MGQQPDVQLDLTDLPRPEPGRRPERRWRPVRPGDLTSPEEVPWGGLFGTTGPDTGYALRLLSTFDLDPGDITNRRDIAVGVVSVAGARASALGRAPVRDDVEAALLLLGFLPEGLPDKLVEDLRRRRRHWFANVAHEAHKARRLAAAVPLEVLTSPVGEIRRRMREGERLADLPAPDHTS